MTTKKLLTRPSLPSIHIPATKDDESFQAKKFSSEPFMVIPLGVAGRSKRLVLPTAFGEYCCETNRLVRPMSRTYWGRTPQKMSIGPVTNGRGTRDVSPVPPFVNHQRFNPLRKSIAYAPI